MNLIKTSLS
uniref:Uncharacterized protein n=1 Tax=Rhizophora mucronata TaxID=61149 RepID=A0A2P2NN54_RHIMU